ncbi:MAG: DUF4097 domain-containing protein [Chloroflexia bacterium]|nr:DUF4097 domain-containing protein [Chloroflexia bacterium]
MEAETASGEIGLENVEFTIATDIRTASGNIKIDLMKSLTQEMNLSTASGNIKLDYKGNEVKGFFEFIARQDKGKIISPFKFDKEEVIEKDGKNTIRNRLQKVLQVQKFI